MSLVLVVAPTAEPVSTDEARKQVRGVPTDTDITSELTSWIQAAREIGETYTRRRFIDQTLDWKFDGFPRDGLILRLPVANVTAISSISYVDTNGDTQTWSSANYRTDLPTGPKCERGRIQPAYGVSWPTTRDIINAVTIRLIAGYGATAATVPEAIKVGMKALIGHWDRTREAVNVGNIVSEVPMGVTYTWKPFQTN